MRNNQDRMGLVEPKDNLQPNEEPPPTAQMEFVVPTEIVELPSKGLFYPEGHPLHGRATVEIKHMTTKEEDILTNQSYIKNGVAIDKLLRSVLVEPRMNIADMHVGDKNALTVACRVHGYGPEYKTKTVCPSCGHQGMYTFDLSVLENNDFENGMEEFGAIPDYENGLIKMTIPRTKTQLELRVLKEDTNTNQKSKKKNSAFVTNQYFRMIHSVNGNTNPTYVRKYIESMSALDSRFLRAAYSKIVPGVDFTHEFECDECGAEVEMEVPLTAEFFWPKS